MLYARQLAQNWTLWGKLHGTRRYAPVCRTRLTMTMVIAPESDGNYVDTVVHSVQQVPFLPPISVAINKLRP